MAVVYCWSNKGSSYFVANHGSTHISQIPYISHFEDEFGCRAEKELPRPIVCEYYYSRSPAIDDANKERQDGISLESKWETQNCWFRLLCMRLGTACVNPHRSYIFEEKQPVTVFKTFYHKKTILEFANILCKDMQKLSIVRRLATRDYLLTARGTPSTPNTLPSITWATAATAVKELVPYVNWHGNMYKSESQSKFQKRDDEGDASRGNRNEASCYICRKYSEKLVFTTFMCNTCGTPLCKKERTSMTRMMLCFEEHMSSPDSAIRCDSKKKSHFPPNLKNF